jgi:hypothetical protein
MRKGRRSTGTAKSTGAKVFGPAIAMPSGQENTKNALDNCSGFGGALGTWICFVIHSRWIHPSVVGARCRGGGDSLDSGKADHHMKVVNTGDAGYPEDEAIRSSPDSVVQSNTGGVEQWKSRGMDVIRNHPVASILGAFAIGIIIAKVAHRERS